MGKLTTLFIVAIAFDLAVYIAYAGGLGPTSWMPQNYTQPAGLLRLFTPSGLSMYDWAMLGGTTIINGIMAYVVNKLYGAQAALIMWVVGFLLGPIGFLVGDFPATLKSIIIAIGNNSTDANTLGTIIDWVIRVIFNFGAFMGVVTLASQRVSEP